MQVPDIVAAARSRASHRGDLPPRDRMVAVESCFTAAPARLARGTAIAERPVMTHLRRIALSLAAVGMVTVAGCSDNNHEATLHVHNQSDFSIVEIHVTSVNSTTWGPNLIEGDVLAPDETLQVDIECGFYDALLVDQQGVDCQVHNVELCGSHADWLIENKTCTVFGGAQAAAGANGSAAPGAK